MENKQICSINLDASRGSNVILDCKLSERSNGCSWKRRDNAMSITGRYSYLDDSRKEPRHDCSIAIREITDIDKGKWTCEEMAADTGVTSDGQSKIQQCKMTIQHKQDQTSSHIPNIVSSIPQHYSSVTPMLDSQLTTTEMATNWNNSQVNVWPNAKAVLYSFTGLFGALGVVVLIACIIFIIHFIYDRLQRRTTDNRSNESQMEMNERGQRRIGDNLGGYAASDNFIVDSIDQLYDDTIEKPIKNKKKKNGRVRSGSREWLPGNQHQNLDSHNHSKQRKYLKLIFGSLLPSSRANSNVTMSSKSLNTPKVAPDNIKNRHPPTVTDTRSSFASEEALNHQYQYIGVGFSNPRALTISPPSTARTLLSNPSDRLPDTRLAAKHNVSFSVNTNTRKEKAPLPQALQHSVSTTQLPKYMTSSFTPKIPATKPQLRQADKVKIQLNRTNPTLPTFQEMIPKRISTLAVNENPTFSSRPPLPPPLPKYEPAETGEPITNSNDDPSYEEVWLESPKITNNEVVGCSTNSETSKINVGDHETTTEFSLYENYVDLVKDSSPSKDGNGAHNLFSPTSTQEKFTIKMMNPVKKKKPRPLVRTTKTSNNNC